MMLVACDATRTVRTILADMRRRFLGFIAGAIVVIIALFWTGYRLLRRAYLRSIRGY